MPDSSSLAPSQPPVLPNYLVGRPVESHKGFYGHALLVAGSLGKMGAAVLAAKACLRSGVGLLTVHVPRCGVQVMQTAVPEAMVSVDQGEDSVVSGPVDLDRYDAFAFGPGLGLGAGLSRILERLLRMRGDRRIVIDADGLNLLSQCPGLYPLLQGALLTPHVAEFERLFGQVPEQQRFEVQRAKAVALGCDLLLKGHRSRVVLSSGEVYVNPTGNAGMATGGSGDVLTGIALAMCAQRKGFERHGIVATGAPELVTAVYLHGKSADLAVEKQSMASLTAGDIVENIKYAID